MLIIKLYEILEPFHLLNYILQEFEFDWDTLVRDP